MQLEIQGLLAKDHRATSDDAYGAESEQVPQQSYHLSLVHHDDLLSPHRTAYLGPGTSAQLLDSLIKNAVRWRLAHKSPLPERLLSGNLPSVIETGHVATLPSFSLIQDQRKMELQSLIPPSTQRALIEHFLRTVSPEYTLFPAEIESALLTHDQPLRWSSLNKTNPVALAISIVFAISAALVARDMDPHLSTVSLRYASDVQRMSETNVSPSNPIEATRWTCTALLALALCESVSPTSGQFWDLLGRTSSTIEDLREGYQIRSIGLDAAFHRLERSLLKLER